MHGVRPSEHTEAHRRGDVMIAKRCTTQVHTPRTVERRRNASAPCLARRAASLMLLLSTFLPALTSAQSKQPDWKAVEQETMQHFQAVLRLNTSNPPGNERLVAAYVKQVFDKE